MPWIKVAVVVDFDDNVKSVGEDDWMGKMKVKKKKKKKKKVKKKKKKKKVMMTEWKTK